MLIPSFYHRRSTSAPGGMERVQEVIAKAVQLNKAGKEFIDCGLGETSHGLTTNLIKAGEKALKSDEFYYVKPIQGLPELRTLIAQKVSGDVGTGLTPHQVIVTPGAELGLDLVFRTFLNPSDEVIIFDPFFIPFATFARTYGANIVFIETYSTDFTFWFCLICSISLSF